MVNESLLAPLNSCCNAIPQTCLHLQQGSILQGKHLWWKHLKRYFSTLRNAGVHLEMGTVTEKLQLTGIKEFANSNTCCPGVEDQWQGRASSDILTSESKQLNRGTTLMYMNVISCWMHSSFHLWEMWPMPMHNAGQYSRLILSSQRSCWWMHLAWAPVVGQIKEESVKVGGEEQHPAKETSLYYLLQMPWTPFSTLLQTAGFFLVLSRRLPALESSHTLWDLKPSIF